MKNLLTGAPKNFIQLLFQKISVNSNFPKSRKAIQDLQFCENPNFLKIFMKIQLKQVFICTLFITMVLLFLLPSKTLAASDYTINSYNIEMNVNENNSFDITENIGAFFNVAQHGIYRTIPLKNDVVREDGTEAFENARITNIKVSDPFTTSTSNGNKVLQIGDPNTTLTGAKDYTISYTYNLGKDTGNGYDEFYYNLVGTGWETTISNITFTINMPKAFDASKLGFSAGAQGTSGTTDVQYQVNGNTITGQYTGTLQPNEGLTVRLELPEGYFVGASWNLDIFSISAIVFPIIFLLIMFLLWRKVGKDDPVVETVEFYPPEGYNSAELGYIYHGEARDKDVVSLMVYLANKGYIKIEETKERGIFSSNKGFKILKVKDYDGNNKNEKLFLEKIFSYGDEVTETDLQNSFYTTLEKIKINLGDGELQDKIYEKSSTGKSWIGNLMMVVIFLLITLKPIWDYYSGDSSSIIMALIFTGFGILSIFNAIFAAEGKRVFYGLIVGLVLAGFGFFEMVLPALQAEIVYIPIYIYGLIMIAGIGFFIKIMPKRTKYGNELIGKIRGFKNFLETAEKEQLEAQVEKEPEYFYNILPFTYVLGVSDKWIKKFENIAIAAPQWYSGVGTFNAIYFGAFMGGMMTSATNVMASVPAPAGGAGGFGGGFSGGGFSGGGFGGGGGGSW